MHKDIVLFKYTSHVVIFAGGIIVLEQDNIFDFFLDSIKKFLYPEDWLKLDLSFSKSERKTCTKP